MINPLTFLLSKRACSSKSRNLLGACLAHVLHDGYTDQVYALQPAWQAQFGLSYMGLAIVRELYYGTMGGLQVPADRFATRLKPRSILALSTFLAALGFAAMALPTGFLGLCVGLVLAGTGSSVQHPRASELVTHSRAGHWESTILLAIWVKPPFLQSLHFCCLSCPGELSSGSWPFSGCSSDLLSLQFYRISLARFQFTNTTRLSAKVDTVSACCS